MINFDLSEEQLLIKKTAKEFAKNELLSGAIERDDKKIWPLDKDYQINKLDTHLSNFKNILMSNIKFEIQFSSTKGIIKLN